MAESCCSTSMNSSTNPFWEAITTGVRQAAQAVGLRFVDYQNTGQVSQWVQGMNEAIVEHAGAIILNAQTPSLLTPQIEAAHRAGIKILSEHLYYPGQKLPAGVDGTGYAPFVQAGQLEADSAIANTNGHADVLIITSNDIIPSAPMAAAANHELTKYCPGCKWRSINVDSASWSTEIQNETESALTADPNINYIIPVFDPMSEYVVPAVVAKNMKGKVHVSTYNGTPFALKFLEDNDVIQVEIGESPPWIGWACVDQALRLMAGLPVAPLEQTPLRVIVASNVKQTGTPPVLGQGVGVGYQAAYLKLWEVSGA